jgi:PERQ amino acid-rich with GYF domain-containing protein
VILKGIERGDVTNSGAQACKDGSAEKSNPDVVPLEQSNISLKQLLTFVINLQKLLNHMLIVFRLLYAAGREDQAGSSEDLKGEITISIRGM